jgi:hypothetical protein
MDVGLEMFLLMGLILKIPVAAACWLIWHAVRAEPDVVEGDEVTDEGHQGGRFRRQPKPKRPRGPRRGPHAPDALPIPCPADDGELRVSRPTAVPGLATGSARERG